MDLAAPLGRGRARRAVRRARAPARPRTAERFDFQGRARASSRPLCREQHAAWLTAYTSRRERGPCRPRRAAARVLAVRRPTPPVARARTACSSCSGFYHAALEQRIVRAAAGGDARGVAAEPLYEFLTPSTSRFDRPARAPHGTDPTGGYARCRSHPNPTSSTCAGRAGVARRPHPQPRVDAAALGAGVEPVGDRCDAHRARRRDPRERPAPSTCGCRTSSIAASSIGPTGGPRREHSGRAGDPDRRERHARVGRDREQRGSERLGRRRRGPADPSRYATPGGSEPFAAAAETDRGRGGRRAEPFEVRTTRWGPSPDSDRRGRPLALHAAWLEPGGLNLDIFDLCHAATYATAPRVLHALGRPVAQLGARGREPAEIAWTVNGPLPRRVGFDGSRPEVWADGSRGVGRRARTRRRCSAGRRRAVHREQPHPAARRARSALSRMWMRPLRAPRIDGAARGGATFARTRLPRDAARHAHRRLRPDSRHPARGRAGRRNRAAARRARERTCSRGTAAPTSDQTGFRILHLYYRALLERALAPLLAPARRSGSRVRLPLAARGRAPAPAARRAAPASAHARVRGLARVPARGVARRAARASRPTPPGPASTRPGATRTRSTSRTRSPTLPVIGDLLGPWLRLPCAPCRARRSRCASRRRATAR